MSFSRGSPRLRDRTRVSCFGSCILCYWATWEAHWKISEAQCVFWRNCVVEVAHRLQQDERWRDREQLVLLRGLGRQAHVLPFQRHPNYSNSIVANKTKTKPLVPREDLVVGSVQILTAANNNNLTLIPPLLLLWKQKAELLTFLATFVRHLNPSLAGPLFLCCHGVSISPAQNNPGRDMRGAACLLAGMVAGQVTLFSLLPSWEEDQAAGCPGSCGRCVSWLPRVGKAARTCLPTEHVRLAIELIATENSPRCTCPSYTSPGPTAI